MAEYITEIKGKKLTADKNTSGANLATVASVNTLKTNIENGSVVAGKASSAMTDGLGNDIALTYLTSASAESTYLKQTSASTIYLTKTSASNTYATKDEVSAQVASVYKPQGSIAFASLPTPSASTANNVYNITDAFTTTSDFVEGANKSYPAGTNVVIIKVGTAYKYDVLSGVVDLSPYTKTADLLSGAVVPNKATNADFATSANTATNATNDGAGNPIATTYLKKTDASGTYLSKTDASSTYLSKTSASSTYLTQSNASTTYLTITGAKGTYLSKTDASSTYATKDEAVLVSELTTATFSD